MEAIKFVLENPQDAAGHARLHNVIEQTKLASAHLASVAQLTPQEELVCNNPFFPPPFFTSFLQLFSYYPPFFLFLPQEAKLRAEEVKRKKLAAQAAMQQQQQPPLQRVKIGMFKNPKKTITLRKRGHARIRANIQLLIISAEGPVNQAVLMAAQQVEEAVATKVHDNSPLGQLVSKLSAEREAG